MRHLEYLWAWTQSTQRELIHTNDRKPVLEFRASLGGLWEQAGAERFVLRADYKEAASRCSAPGGEKTLLPWVVWDKPIPPHFSH